MISRTELELAVVIQRKETLADGVVRLTLRHPEGEPLPEWSAGAHVDLLLAPGLVRQYSLCGDPQDQSVLQIAVLLEPQSRGGSLYVHNQLVEGAELRIRGPRNNFELVRAPRYLFIAGGIGITPILPMIAAAEAQGADWKLVYGGRTRSSMAFQAELIGKYGERVVLQPQDECGLLDLDGLLQGAQEGTAFYCCGPEPLLAAVEERCAERSPGSLHVERFSPKAGAVQDVSTAFEVELAESGMVLTVPPDKSILEAVQQAGIEVPSSCQEGTCGTCETPVLEGKPDHRDSVLGELERELGECMMICVSRACSERLVLEL